MASDSAGPGICTVFPSLHRCLPANQCNRPSVLLLQGLYPYDGISSCETRHPVASRPHSSQLKPEIAPYRRWHIVLLSVASHVWVSLPPHSHTLQLRLLSCQLTRLPLFFSGSRGNGGAIVQCPHGACLLCSVDLEGAIYADMDQKATPGSPRNQNRLRVRINSTYLCKCSSMLKHSMTPYAFLMCIHHVPRWNDQDIGKWNNGTRSKQQRMRPRVRRLT